MKHSLDLWEGNHKVERAVVDFEIFREDNFEDNSKNLDEHWANLNIGADNSISFTNAGEGIDKVQSWVLDWEKTVMQREDNTQQTHQHHQAYSSIIVFLGISQQYFSHMGKCITFRKEREDSYK